MLTVLEALQLSADYLSKKGIDSSRLNAELILSNILNLKRLELYLNWERPLAENEISSYREMLKRRGNREPLQYILGEVEFYGYPFKVNPSVLIPRPETELLVETIVLENSNKNDLNILDLGTGSGIIAISLARNLNCKITAVDINSKALETALFNADLNKTLDKIEFVKADILNDNIIGEFDIIVSNPPYISKEDYNVLEPELKVYEPSEALTDYMDGLTFYKAIISKAKTNLKKNGKIYFELGQGQSLKVKSLLEQNHFININIINDYQSIGRVISGEVT
jgi:release factor glutamine methyltransferase